MLVSPEKAKFSRRRRNEQVLNSLTKIIGYSALVAIVAAVFYVVIEKMMQPSKIDQAYLESIYEEDTSQGARWSGIKESQPSLFSLRNSGVVLPQGAPAKGVSESSGPKTDLQRRDEERVALGLPKAEPPPTGIVNVEAKRPLIEETVRKFFEAGSVSEKLAFVRDPGRVRPLMTDYYHRRPMPPVKWHALGWTLPVDEPGFRLGYVQAMFEGGPPSSLIVEEMENGSFAVDWESFVRYGELNWQDFLMIRPVQPKLFRIIASKAENETGGVVGMGREMIEIKHPEEEGVVYATLDRNDPTLAPMVQQLQQGKWKDVPLTLRLCYPGTASDGKAVRIAGIEGKGWLILQPTRS